MNPLALPFIVLGVVCALRPYKVARFNEQLDAIGSSRSWSSVEPADWNVALTKYGGVFVALLGVLLLFSA
jgi:hypothetical protein